MINELRKYFRKNYLPRSIILVFDVFVVVLSVVFAHLILDKVHLNKSDQDIIFKQIAATVPVYLVGFLFFRPFSGVIRHSTLEDVSKIFYSLTSSLLTLIAINVFIPKANFFYASISLLLLQYLVILGIMVISRVFIKIIFQSVFISKNTNKNILIYGAGSLGQLTYNTIANDGLSESKVVGFIDENRSLQKKRISAVPVYSPTKAFRKVISEYNIEELIIAVSQDKLLKSNKRKIVDLCIKKGIKVKEIPAVSTWIDGGLNVKHFKDVKIEDLLGRDAIQLDREKIREGVKDATVLVTGAAGSIGSELVRQLIAFKAKKVILLDQAESASYDLQIEINAANDNPSFEVVIADVTNRKKLYKVFKEFSPDIVFDAAAYKHVPLMEEHPCEALRVNIGGTKVLADLAVEFGVKKFVYISTDKAVNPSSVMGATKRISEIYIQSLSQNNGIETKFITTRFGNVLGSNGSVIPLFKKQIEAGGPVTVTDKEITRFFMTIPEACQLVLEAGFMGKGGEIFIFDMGEPIKIYSLAKKMIALSGLVLNKDIEIKITGLRPGEKLYEELLKNQENLQPTHNDKIMIGTTQQHNYEEVNTAVSYLIKSADDLSKQDLVFHMKAIVPEYISMNSVHCCLDKSSKMPASVETPVESRKILIKIEKEN